MGKLLERIGLDGRRIKMINVSSAMGSQFAQLASDMTLEIQGLGPNPLRPLVERAGRCESSDVQPGASKITE